MCNREKKKKQPWVAIDGQRFYVPQTRVKADVTSEEDVKKVIKSGGHRACFDAKMLTNTAI